MKVLAFSDPHIDIAEKRGHPDFLEDLYDYVSNLTMDVMLVTGDIAGSSEYIQKFLARFQDLKVTKLYVPGNHDIWVHQDSKDGSWVKYYHLLPELSSLYGWHYLPLAPYVADKVAFIGTMGWYDYSTRNKNWDDQISTEYYNEKINPKTLARWMDGEFAKFGNFSDNQISEHFIAEVIDQLDILGIDVGPHAFSKIEVVAKLYPNTLKRMVSKFSSIVFASHIVPFSSFVKHTNNIDWDYFSAFIGNTRLGDIMQNIPEDLSKHAFFGHTHFPKVSSQNGINAYCVPIGYPHEWKTNSIRSLLKKRIKIVDL